MNNWVTSLACIAFLLLFIVAALIIARDWVRMAVGQVRFGRHMYEEFNAQKQEWESQRSSQEGTPLHSVGAEGPSPTSPDAGPGGRP